MDGKTITVFGADFYRNKPAVVADFLQNLYWVLFRANGSGADFPKNFVYDAKTQSVRFSYRYEDYTLPFRNYPQFLADLVEFWAGGYVQQRDEPQIES